MSRLAYEQGAGAAVLGGRPVGPPGEPLQRAGLPPQSAARYEKVSLSWTVRLYLFCVIFPITFNAGPLALTTLRIFLILMFLPLMWKVISGGLGRIFATDILFVAHVFWATVALAVNNPDRVIEQAGSVGIEFIGGYLIGRAYVRNLGSFLALCRTLTTTVVLLSPFAIYETLTGNPPILQAIAKIPGATTVELNYQDQRMGLERVQMTFAHPIHFGLFCSVVFSLTFVGLKDQMSTVTRLLASAIVALCGFLALSSGALLAIALQFGLITWSLLFKPSRARWWVLVGLFSFVYVIVDLISNRSALQVFLSYATFSAHTAYWRTIIFEWGVYNVMNNPLFGIGLNDWVRPWFMYSGSMDNYWLVMAVRYGIPGFVLVAVGYWLCVFRIMFRDFQGDEALSQVRRAWVFTFMGLSFTLCTVHVWSNMYSFAFFIMGAGMWMMQTVARTGDVAVPAGPAPRGYLRAGPVDPSPDASPEPAVAPQTSRYSRFNPVVRPR